MQLPAPATHISYKLTLTAATQATRFSHFLFSVQFLYATTKNNYFNATIRLKIFSIAKVAWVFISLFPIIYDYNLLTISNASPWLHVITLVVISVNALCHKTPAYLNVLNHAHIYICTRIQPLTSEIDLLN